jgi:hypothetical protein
MPLFAQTGVVRVAGCQVSLAPGFRGQGEAGVVRAE